jgi:putative endonuclease
MPRLPWVYMLRCGDGSLYTGVAKDVSARLKQHQEGKGARYTRAHLPVTGSRVVD